MDRTATLSLAAVLLLLGALALGTVLAGAAPSAAPLPSGAAFLELRTQPPVWRFPWLPRGCGLAALNPVTLEVDDGALVFISQLNGTRVPVVFPSGFSGRLVDGRGELASPSGTTIARQGDLLTGLGGSSADNGDFLVCFATPDEYDEVVGG